MTIRNLKLIAERLLEPLQAFESKQFFSKKKKIIKKEEL